MARYVVALWLSSNVACRVGRQITRKDDSRAIAFAEEWLHKSCISTRLIWMTYDRWTVLEALEDGEIRHVRDGIKVDSPAYRAGFKVPKKVRAKKPEDPLSGNGFIYPTTGKRRKVLTPLQARFAEMKAVALERRDNSVTIPRVGGNTHD